MERQEPFDQGDVGQELDCYGATLSGGSSRSLDAR